MSDITPEYDAEDGPESCGGETQQHARLTPVQPGYAAAHDDAEFDSELSEFDDEDDDLTACEAQESDEEQAAPARSGLEPIIPGQTGGFGIADVLFPAAPPPVKHARVIRSFG